jgi:predicted O-methyltransferase YrrM
MTLTPYRTTELELAAFLKARGHRLLSAKQNGKMVTFEFIPDAAKDADNYFSGAESSARELFEAHRSLRALIQQVREHSSQKIGSEHTSNEHYTHRR